MDSRELGRFIQSRRKDLGMTRAELGAKIFAILCFIIYSLLSLVFIHYAPTCRLSWLAPMEKMLFLLTAATFIYASHKEYNAMWISVPTAAAFFLKILRTLGYRFFISFILSSGEKDAILSHFHKAYVVFGIMDTVVFLLLLIALIRIILLGSFWRWYSKTINSAAKGDTP